MLRRHLIELGAGVAVGAPAAKLALLLEHLVELPDPSPAPLPSQLSGVHVVKVRDLARRLHEAGRVYGSEPEVSSSAAAWASKLLNVRGAEPVKRALMVAVAELHLEAGWAGGSTAVSTTGPSFISPARWSWPRRPATPTAKPSHSTGRD